jgi:hypothetical protein
MPEDDINYAKEALKSQLNLGFIGIMGFLMLVVNFWGFLPLLLAGELGAVVVAQSKRVQQIIRDRLAAFQKEQDEEAETGILENLPRQYREDFHSVRVLCEEIERRSTELGRPDANPLLNSTLLKLSSFRQDYVRMLRAHHLLSNRDYGHIQAGLNQEIGRSEKALAQESSPQVRHALGQNLNILKQRLARIQKLDELVRLLEARLQVTRNSLGLIQDEVYTFTDVAGISGLVDSLLTNMKISDEFRSAYEDVLHLEAGEGSFQTLEGPVPAAGLETTLPPLPSSREEHGSKPGTPSGQIRRVK